MIDRQVHNLLIPDMPMPAEVRALQQRFTDLWWHCDTSLPDLGRTYTAREQAEHETDLDLFLGTVTGLLKSMPRDPAERAAVQQQIIALGSVFAQSAFGFSDEQLAAIQSSGLAEAATDFAQSARRFDGAIRSDDIFQAGRNALTMNLLQLLAGLPVRLSPAILAYSLLYPYSDNYLDDPSIPRETKLAFNERFRRRLAGDSTPAANDYERKISDLVGMVEGQYDRARHPRVYDSLFAIHRAQTRSLALMRRDASPYEVDVLGLSFEKGGTAVLADAYLVSGAPTALQLDFAFAYGAFTQLMDDQEDVLDDVKAGRLSLFSQTAQHWPLDGLTNRLFHFGAWMMDHADEYGPHAAAPLVDALRRSVNMLLIDAAGKAAHLYSKPYLQALEAHLPFRFAALRKQREKLQRQGATYGRFIESFAFSGDFGFAQLTLKPQPATS